MLRCTRGQWVVFTQGFPVLGKFAQDHFLPSNPLSSSCLWLDEDDIRGAIMAARAHGCPNPLRIDPYAHHPVLSRFAAKTIQRKSRPSPTAATFAEALAGGQAIPDTQQIADLLQNPEDAGCAVRRGSPSQEMQSPPPPKKRGRPPKAAAVRVEPVSVERATAADLSQYRVPICTVVIPKPLYILNMDQMFLHVHSGSTWAAGDAEEERRESGAHKLDIPYSAAHPFFQSSKPHLWPGSLNRVAFAGDSTSTIADQPLSSSSHSDLATDKTPFPDFRLTSEALTAGIRALQQKFPNPVREEARFMYSIVRRRKYGLQRQRDLWTIAMRNRYQSRWWGTRRQWADVGASVRPGQQEHVVPVAVSTKLVHISLIENAAAVLQRAFIAPRRRKLVLFFEESGDTENDNTGVMEAGVVAGRLGSDEDWFSVTERPRYNPLFSDLEDMMREDMRRMNYKIPLYLSKNHIKSLGLSVRPNARGINRQLMDAKSTVQDGGGLETANGTQAHSSDDAPPPLLLRRSSTTQHCCWYHISQVHFPASYLISSAVLFAEMDHPGVAVHGTTGTLLTYPELSYASLVERHPDIAALLWADPEETAKADLPKESPSADDDQDSIALPTPKSTANHETGSTIQADASEARVPAKVPLDERSIAHFVATHAVPTLVKGRHLWFEAEDVLASNGIVDVNSAPVEVSIQKGQGSRIAGGDSSDTVATDDDPAFDGVPNSTLFNVEALTDPDEALRKLCTSFVPS
ncbi:putative mitochondrial hypothetical protein [Leptomonas pyrrhocoris]|uniref:N-terminal domain-containing protein n=1 Tax=Leptomonas pyrrhocoris TaxID=157538 RepID=A0A0M9G7I9_LEPPY|nr:putative mitochondrial hypothetical protein [Leptomonas pyrrhocoris]KPA83979.1 putative mitochondrial hypothetical protein [Leptomonas pyrrhocoris]|eukprot:XP_015662418.1 putative mitochondrial hypothetical protein [Leptomonas pyrrhocoris]